jgi:hypothetical protein
VERQSNENADDPRHGDGQDHQQLGVPDPANVTTYSVSHLRLPALDLPAGLLARLRRLAEASETLGVMYAQISEDREGAGLGVERQLEDQCALFGQLGLRLAGVYADNDLSAFTGKPRSDYLAMLADLDAGRARVVTAWHTDRLHRSPKELETYIDLAERRGVVTHSVKAGPLDLATPSGRAVAHLVRVGAV